MNRIIFILLLVIAFVMMMALVYSMTEPSTVPVESKVISITGDVEELGSLGRVLYGLIGLVIFLFGLVVVVPTISTYATYMMLNPILAIALVYIPIFLGLLIFISTVLGGTLFSMKAIKWVFLLMLVTILIDVWYPIKILSEEGNIFLAQGYRTSMDYVLFWCYRALFGVNITTRQVFGLSVCWILVYVVSSSLLTLFTIIYAWGAFHGKTNKSEELVYH